MLRNPDAATSVAVGWAGGPSTSRRVLHSQPSRHAADDSAAVGVIGVVLLVGISVSVAVVAYFLYMTLQDAPASEPVTSAQASFTPSGYIVSLSGPEDIPVNGETTIVLDIDGVQTTLPLSAISSQLPDPTIWKVGQSVCFVGAAPCLRPEGEFVGVTVTNGGAALFTLPPLRYVVAGPSFLILPTGGVQLACDQPSALRVLGGEITYGAGGPTIPVTMGVSITGGAPFTPLFGGPVTGGEVLDLGTVAAGAILGVQGSADYSDFHKRYDSFSSSPHVISLRDGDPAPEFAPFDGQAPLEGFLAPYVNTSSQTMTLGPNEAIILFEFTDNLQSSAADFQDLVVLFQFDSPTC